MGGVKNDQGKPRISLIPREALEQEARAFQRGVEKYQENNWRLGMNYTRLIDAMLRHTVAYMEGENNDEEGIPHLASIRANAGILLDYHVSGIGFDDRRKLRPMVPRWDYGPPDEDDHD